MLFGAITAAAAAVSSETGGALVPDASPVASRCELLRQRMATGAREACVVFHHIPKTAGALDGGILPSGSGKRVWAHYGALPASPPVDKDEYALFQGHWTPAFSDEFLGRNCWRVTMLREPIDHALSAFYFHGHTTPEWPSCLAGRCSVTTSAGGNGCCAEQYAEGQTRQLGSSLGVDVYTGALGSAFPLDEETAMRAHVNLAAMDVVGLTEDRDTFVAMVTRLLKTSSSLPAGKRQANGTAAAAAAPHASASSQRRVTLSNATLEAIAIANADDLNLYELALQLAEEDAACLLDDEAALGAASPSKQTGAAQTGATQAGATQAGAMQTTPGQLEPQKAEAMVAGRSSHVQARRRAGDAKGLMHLLARANDRLRERIEAFDGEHVSVLLSDDEHMRIEHFPGTPAHAEAERLRLGSQR